MILVVVIKLFLFGMVRDYAKHKAKTNARANIRAAARSQNIATLFSRAANIHEGPVGVWPMLGGMLVPLNVALIHRGAHVHNPS